MVRRVYEQALKSGKLNDVIVATDDQRIFDHVKSFEGKVMMTSPDHKNGTERCNEVVEKLEGNIDFVINIQGDEPFINPEQINQVANLLDPTTQIATLIKKIQSESELFNPNVNKVVVSESGFALYFSRTTIPYLRNVEQKDWIESHHYFKHIGIYGYRTDILKKIVNLPPSPLELAESLEQLRWLENGYSIRTGITEIESIGIDTPEDVNKIDSHS